MKRKSEIEKEKLQDILSKTTCRGCYNHCILTAPCCRRSEIFIKETIEKWKNDEK